jgi:hypothetical protein
MRQILTIALSALLLCGCIAEWKSNRTGPRWNDGPHTTPMDQTSTPPVNPMSHSGPNGPQP